jgi:hypothetical protein
VELLVPESLVPAVETARADIEASARVREMTIVSVPDTADGDSASVSTRAAELVADDQ